MHGYLYLRRQLRLLCTANGLEIWTSKFEPWFYLQIFKLWKLGYLLECQFQIILLDKIAPRAIALDVSYSVQVSI